MLLVIDIGNTDGVFAIYHENIWWPTHRIPSQRGQGASAYIEGLSSYLGEHKAKVKTVVMGSVVPELAPAVTGAVNEVLPQASFLRMGPDLYPSLPLQILKPHEIGEDIVANVLAAHHEFNQACIVVDFGTALTFVACDDAGTIQGVAIAPGLKTSIKAIFMHAAQLPEIPLNVPETALGKDTTHAIQAGILLGYESLVSGMLDRMESEMGQRCRIVATGGLSFVLSSLKHRFDMTDLLLTLKGLRLAAQYGTQDMVG